MEECEAGRGSSASTPDLDWSQVRETVLMLDLAAGQIEAAMHDGGNSVAVLSGSFTSLAGNMQQIAACVESLPDGDGSAPLKAQLAARAEEALAGVRASIVAFQFYDKLAQRLAHVCHGLDSLAELVGDRARLDQPAEWAALQESIRARYSTREEHEMFDAVMRGMSVREALERYRGDGGPDGADDVELF